jgi:hypothetical protein
MSVFLILPQVPVAEAQSSVGTIESRGSLLPPCLHLWNGGSILNVGC